MKYDFDKIYERKNSEKWMELERKFGSSDLISFWEADMDFQSAQPVIDALVERAKEGSTAIRPNLPPIKKQSAAGIHRATDLTYPMDGFCTRLW